MPELLEKGTLQHGLTIGEKTHKDFVMGPIENMGQMFDAEKECDVDKPMTFRAALMAAQLQSLGDYKGPFTLGMMRSLKPADYNLLSKALDILAEAEEKAGKGDASD